MSASLVGSEMCIRDRVTWEASKPQTAKVRVCPACGSRFRPSGAVCAPVSYTHLTLPTICSV
eukprot:3088359-Alexandrium_andersonii.AAC.1